VLPFSDHVVALPRPLKALDSIVANAELLASLPSGGTSCSAPLRRLNAERKAPDLVVFVSDNQSWADFSPGLSRPHADVGPRRGTAMAEEWERLRSRNPRAKLVLVDLQPYATTQVRTRPDVLNVGGFSDAVFDVLASFLNDDGHGELLTRKIESIAI
jgi:60 kDa SS-A/Ro ribonucleoprotein